MLAVERPGIPGLCVRNHCACVWPIMSTLLATLLAELDSPPLAAAIRTGFPPGERAGLTAATLAAGPAASGVRDN
ncbi:MAG: hypothetical protein QOK11_1552 [Pseudonocardiales bacterium]|nr:hypothetical protein [Pseudonocardiales bacterium]